MSFALGLLAVLALLDTTTCQKTAFPCPSDTVDLVLLIDSSGSVEKEFKHEKQLALDVINGLPIRSRGTHLGIVTFAANSEVIQSLHTGGDRDAAINWINTIKHRGGSTNVLAGLQDVRNDFLTRGRSHATKILLIISDGHSQNEWRVLKNFFNTLRKQDGITVFAATRSVDPSLLELEIYTGSRDLVFLNSEQEIPRLKSLLLNTTAGGRGPCPPTGLKVPVVRPSRPVSPVAQVEKPSRPVPPVAQERPDCTPADFLFVLDSSGSVEDDFVAQRRYIEEIIQRLTIGPSVHRVALVEYSGIDRELVIDFNDYNNQQELLEAVRALQHYKGTTKTGLALNVAYQALSERRPNVKTIVITVSDGFSQDDVEGPAAIIRNTPGVLMYAVGVGRPLNREELKTIAGAEDRALFGSNVDPLVQILRAYIYCEGVRPPPVEYTRPPVYGPGPDKVKPPVEAVKKTPETAVVKPEIAFASDCTPADFVIVLDSSGSVQDDFNTERRFVEGVVSRLTIAPTVHRLAVVEYSGLEQNVEIDFDDYTDTASLLQAVRDLKHYQGTTRTGKALEKANEVLRNRRSGVKTFVITVSDGFSQDDVEGPAGAIRNLGGIVMYSVGVTEPVNKLELVQISGAEDRTFIGNSDSALLARLNPYIACDGRQTFTRPPAERTVPPTDVDREIPPVPSPPTTFGCKAADFFVILDSSGSVGDDYEQQRRFLLDAAQRLTISSQQHQVGLLQFTGFVQQLEWPLDRYQDQRALIDAIQGLKHIQGTTRTGEAIKKAIEVINGRTSNRDLIIIVITDGFSQDEVGGPSDMIRRLRGVTDVFAVGVTSPVNRQELLRIAGGVEGNAVVGNDANLLLDRLTDYVNCKPTGVLPRIDPGPSTYRVTQPPIRIPDIEVTTPTAPVITTFGCVLDVLLIVDSSGSVTETFHNELALANRVVDRMVVGPGGAQVAMVIFAGPGSAKTVFPFSEFNNKADVQQRISATEFIGGTTAAGDALRLAARELDVSRGLRHNAQQIVIMFTDGLSQQDPKQDALTVQQKTDAVYAVSTGRYANPLQLLDISGDENRIFKRSTMAEFERAMDQLFSKCY